MSSGSESDDDYVPEEPPKLSEEESADDETEKQYENELELKQKKRKIAQEAKGQKKRKTRNVPDPESDPEVMEQKEEELDPEQQKKRDDDLWAMFLDGTDTKPKPKEKDPPKTSESSKVTVSSKAATSSKNEDTKNADDARERERRIFEFAGETIVVENNVIKEKIKTKESPGAALKPPRGGAGISSVLGQLNKKNQLSTLEKSKLDWQTFKQQQGIEEEIQSHNKGKNGYLDKRDFLERADHRQYEIERSLRLGTRSNR